MPNTFDLTTLRTDYTHSALIDENVPDNPLTLVKSWLKEAQTFNLKDPNAMTLATSDANGFPNARIVLLKEISAEGKFTFFTNYSSTKGNELAQNPRACLLFYWAALERQIRIEGHINRTSPEISKTYFKQRPLASQYSAFVSPQSQRIESRAQLDNAVIDCQRTYPEPEGPPCPDNWGGYELAPTKIEFWQGRPSRLHDRIQFDFLHPALWTWCLLAP